ncbi:hypothetical protein [Limosilactobacillus reuteri]|uniref:hypothetical protein n=1 Tax=Limosilactobacillus reuteri TaxID=1598 RepID=UPI00128CBA7D|nr:hypothetical protein [Limosilactobacillus reuteri]MCU4692464.1 hypothetical protein [Limosilactobacillus reuteri]MQB90334.1 hypothetical protein [Limosilactobacillus reuteri]
MSLVAVDNMWRPTFDDYICDLAVLFERYPTKGDQQLHDVRRCLALIDELEKAADRLPELPREKRNNNEN